MNLKEIKELISLMNDNELSEIEIEKEGMKIKLSKGKSIIASGISVENMPAIHAAPAAAPAAPPAGAPQESGIPANAVEIKAPMVGTFYRAPSPESPPFVENGGQISVGQSLCIIEAMKLMNEIKSDYNGKILKVLVENGEPVEFNQPLFLVELT